MQTISLDNPIQIGQQPEIKELTFNDLEAGMLRGFNQDDPMGSTLDVAGKMCAQPSAIMNKLKGKDVKKVLELVGSQMKDFL